MKNKNKRKDLFGWLLVAACLAVACDDGRIYPDIVLVERAGGAVRVSGQVSGQSAWPSGYSLVLAGFSDDSEYAKTAKGLSACTDGTLNLVLSGIPSEVTTIEICAINKLRKRLVSFYRYDYAVQSDTIRLDIGTLDLGMFRAVQTNVFDRTCTSCHGSSMSAAAGLFLTVDRSYDALVNVPADLSPKGLNFVTPGSVDSSFLHQVLNTDVSASWSMDHIDMITSSELLKLVDDWIENGALPPS